ncbi:hypothetical protein [Sphingomonas sp.]|uniref:hypothetical protein n=1 Tax=Sphingomonas sp. TaxID=28214 RepID=UPI0031DE07AA
MIQTFEGFNTWGSFVGATISYGLCLQSGAAKATAPKRGFADERGNRAALAAA